MGSQQKTRNKKKLK
ncbi:hypothetical protein TrRE_jg4124, partial [Triparma retinervis]